MHFLVGFDKIRSRLFNGGVGLKLPNKRRREKLKSQIPFRLNLLFFVVFILFATFILRLAYMQIIKEEEYQAEVDRTESTVISGPVARGEIYDNQLNKLVGNEAHNTITYTRGQNVSNQAMANVANRLANIIDLPNADPFESDDPDITEREMKDYYYAIHRDEIDDQVEAYMEANDIEEMESSDRLDFIDEDQLKSFSDEEKTATSIFSTMTSAYALSTVNIKNQDVSSQELAQVSENLDDLPGVDTGVDWQRVYPEGNMLKSILGQVSSEETGIPEERIGEYLAKGYSRNDRVGISYLEYQFEDVLSGSKSKVETETNKLGEIISQNVRYAGSKGDNLVLNIDIDFQEKMEGIAIDSLNKRRGLNDSIYLIAIDPRDGGILGFTGKRVNDNGEIVDDAMGNLTKFFEMGSSVKGATVLSAYMDGVLDDSNNIIVDAPMNFTGTSSISSVFNQSGSVPLNETQAIQYSSNIYMSRLAMRMGDKWDYEPGEQLNMDYQKSIDKMRYYFSQFGLGVPTGVELPNEMIGQQSPVESPGSALYQSFGQFDTYTPLQLAQYIATIANGGTRYAPRFVSEIRETHPETGEVGQLKTKIEPKILNQIDVTHEQMDRVKEGMYLSVNGDYGTLPKVFGDAEYVAAGKTGTAQASYWSNDPDLRGTSVINMNFTGFAPYDNPEIAVAAVVPYLPDNINNIENMNASKRVMDAYFGVGEFAEDADDQEDEGDEEEAQEEVVQEEEDQADQAA